MTKPWVTIVSGLPRSGTSMMMRMIEAGGIPPLVDGVREADEDNPRGYYELEAVKQIKRNAAFIDRAEGKVLKMVHLLLPDLPPEREYRIVMMRRNLDEVLASQATMLERQGKVGGNLPAGTMKRVFAGQMESVEKWMTQQGKVKSLDVDYNALMQEPRSELDRLVEFLEIQEAVDAMSAVIEPRLYRQRKV